MASAHPHPEPQAPTHFLKSTNPAPPTCLQQLSWHDRCTCHSWAAGGAAVQDLELLKVFMARSPEFSFPGYWRRGGGKGRIIHISKINDWF